MELERFKSKLTKGQLEAMAIDTEKKYLESTDPLEILQFAKKLLYFATEFKEEAEKEAKLVWETHKIDYPSMSYTTGGTIYDWDKDPVYASIKLMLEQRTELLKTAVKMKEQIFDGEGTEVPKCPIKGYRKDSINVKI